MFDKDYVLNELRNGKEYEEIMKEISDVLNEASKEFDVEQQKSSERQNKIDDMQDILDLVHDYCINYYGNSNKEINEINKAFKDETAEQYVDLLDSGLELINSFTDLNKMFNKPKTESKEDIEVNIDKILSDFLKFLK